MIHIIHNPAYHMEYVNVGAGSPLANRFEVARWGAEESQAKYRQWLDEVLAYFSASTQPIRDTLNVIYRHLKQQGYAILCCPAEERPYAEIVRDRVLDKLLEITSKRTHHLSLAEEAAQDLKQFLAPYCERIEIAGSIRRRKAEVGDIELVCIPRKQRVERTVSEAVCEPPSLFYPEGRTIKEAVVETVYEPVEGFCEAVETLYRIKGEPAGKYTQRLAWHPATGPIKVDIFMVTRDSWGLQFMIRTGSAEFSRRMAIQWSHMGLKSVGGILYDAEGKDYPLREEEDVFGFLGVDWVEPQEREVKKEVAV
jgi:DNA polymerase/3'-5' exonuclease PolX